MPVARAVVIAVQGERDALAADACQRRPFAVAERSPTGGVGSSGRIAGAGSAASRYATPASARIEWKRSNASSP
jgi:hypothetical protein